MGDNFDFWDGVNRGHGYNGASALGAQFHTPPRPIYTPPPVYSPPPSPEIRLAIEPMRPLTPEEQAERDRRNANRAIIASRPSLTGRLAFKTISYLNDEGELLTKPNGDLAPGDTVPFHEHFWRLELGYRKFWKARLAEIKAPGEDISDCIRHSEAAERLRLVQRGTYIAPLTRKEAVLKKTLHPDTELFGLRIMPSKNSYVRIREYDRRLRQFMFCSSAGHYRNDFYKSKKIPALDARSQFEFFLSHPCSQMSG